MKIIGTKYNNMFMSASKTSCYGTTAKRIINVVYTKEEMFIEGSVDMILNKLNVYSVNQIEKYLDSTKAACSKAVDYDFEESELLSNEAVDADNTTAIYACVGENDNRTYFIVIGIPFPSNFYFKKEEEFRDYLAKCPFKLRVLKIFE